MKIGIFTDTYRPSVNGVVYVTEILRRNFESLGHEVYIFAPAPGLRPVQDDPHIIRFPAVPSTIEENNISLFFPRSVLKRIKEIDLDVFHFLVPGPIGMMAIYAAHRLKKPLIAEYCTDYYEYVQHYPSALPGILALGFMMPFIFKSKVGDEDVKELFRASLPRFGITKWSQGMVKHLLTVIHEHCDAVIAHSRKSTQQLQSWQSGGKQYKIDTIPTGVDPLPVATATKIRAFKKQWAIGPNDEVVTFVGRLSSEKNLDMLIAMIVDLVRLRPHAKLMLVGDFDYRESLEAAAAESPVAQHIIFTGKIPREELGAALAASKVFVFPSLTDTQGLAIHEAALAGLPIVMIDQAVTEVVRDGLNGYFCNDDSADMAQKVARVLDDPKRYKKMSTASKKIAKEFSEIKQARRIIKIYEAAIKKHATHTTHAAASAH